MTDDDKDDVIDLDDVGPIDQDEKPDRGDDVTPDDDPEPEQPVVPEPEPEPEPVAPVEPRIPKSRFDEVNERMKAAEAKLAEREAADQVRQQAQAQEPAAPKVDLKAALVEKNKAYHQALLDGDFDVVDTLSTEIDDIRDRITETRAREIATKEIEEVRARDNYAAYKDRVEQHGAKIAKEYPFLHDGSDVESRELFDLIRDGAISKGADNITAMEKALAAVLQLRGQDAAPAPSKPTAMNTALMRKLAAAKQQPPRPLGVGNRAAGTTTPGNIADMDEEEFSKIPAAERRRLRGDVI